MSDEVIGEIDQLKSRLAAMNPDALSDEAKLAVRGALAVLEALDVEDKVVTVLDAGYAELDSKVRDLLDDIAAGLERLRRSLGELDPTALLGPVTKELTSIRSAVDSLDAATLTTPLHEELRHLDSWLATLRPGSVLDPLQGTYDDGVAVIRRLDPEVWGAPLAGLHADLRALSDRLDLGPLFTELNDRRRDLVERARDGLTQSVTAAGLPEPVQGWLVERAAARHRDDGTGHPRTRHVPAPPDRAGAGGLPGIRAVHPARAGLHRGAHHAGVRAAGRPGRRGHHTARRRHRSGRARADRGRHASARQRTLACCACTHRCWPRSRPLPGYGRTSTPAST